MALETAHLPEVWARVRALLAALRRYGVLALRGWSDEVSVWIRTRPVKKSDRNPRGKTYAVLYRRGGRMYRVEAAGTFKTEKQAKTRRDLLAGWLAQGLDPKAELAKLKHVEIRHTCKDWADLYLASRVDLSEGSYKAYERHLDSLMSEELGKCDPFLWTPADSQEWIQAHSHLAPSTVGSYVSRISMVFDYAGVKDNPWRDRKVRKPRNAQKTINPPTASHVVTILERIPEYGVLALAVCEQVGSRISETVELTFRDFDEDGRRLRFRRETTKTAKPRWATLPEWLSEAIARSCPREDRVPARRIFPGVTDYGARKWMRKACRDAGIPFYSPHDLRHRYISIKLGQGVPVKDVSAQVGHNRPSITLDVYDHVMPLEEIPVETWLRLVGREQVPTEKARVR